MTTPGQILARAAAAPSLAAYVRSVSHVNPLYAQLRDAAWSQMQANGGTARPARARQPRPRPRHARSRGRYVMVDTGGARLYMIEDGRIVDSMKVIVGKADATTQTPMLASTIYYATLNPYWHVTRGTDSLADRAQRADQGTGYLERQGYQVLAADGRRERARSGEGRLARGRRWAARRSASASCRGRRNSMGRIKIGFPNASDIYLHDTPNKDLFAQDDRTLSHGCIRLQDAERLGRWLMGREPQAASRDPEQNVLLPTPVPIYVTYLTAQVDSGQLSFVDDIYGRDTQVAALRCGTALARQCPA